jgi:hypothetical protein
MPVLTTALTTAAILAGTSAAVQGIGRGIQARQMKRAQEPYQERLDELQRMEEMGALGLTGEEEALFMRQTADPGRALAAQRLEQQQALSEGARGSGEVLAQLTKQAEAERAAMDRAQLATAEADIAKKRAQEAEMQGLAEQLAQMETQRRMMITGAVTEPIAQSLGAASQMVMQQEIASRMSSAQVAAAAERQAAMDYYNMTQAMSNVGGTTVTPGGLPPGGIR